MLSILLIALAAVFKAVNDVIQFKYSESVFTRLPKKYWIYFDPQISWQLPYLPFTEYPPDARHIANTLMQLCFIGAIFCYKPTEFGRWIDFAMCSVVVIVVFNIFYNRILRK